MTNAHLRVAEFIKVYRLYFYKDCYFAFIAGDKLYNFLRKFCLSFNMAMKSTQRPLLFFLIKVAVKVHR